MVNYGQYGVVSVLLRESRDEVHRDLLEREGAFFGRDAVERYPFLVGHDFVLLAGSAAFDVVCDPLPHPCPRQDLCSFSNRFVSAGMSCGWVIVDERHQISFRGIWYLRVGGVYEEFRFEQGLIPVVVISLVGIRW